MAKTSQDLFDCLQNLNIETRTYHHQPLNTVAESQAWRSDLPGAHCKNLFLKDKKQALWLVVARHNAQIDLKQLRKKIGSAHLSFAKPDLLLDVLGVHPGSVTPFALINDPEKRVTLILDSHMMAHDLLNYHPLSNEMTTTLKTQDFRRFIEHCGHPFQEVDL